MSQADTAAIRGIKGSSPTSIGLFVAGRFLSPLAQYAILARGYGSSLITTLGGTVLPAGPALVTGTPFDVGLSPYRSIMLGMSAVAMLKQSIHVTSIMQERLTPSLTATVVALNLAVDTINSLLFVCAQTSASANGEAFPQTPLLIGGTMFVAGIAIELGSEYQRLSFKKHPKNKGKVYQGGLFSLSRHINYFGFDLWRTGYALAAGGYIWAALSAAFFTSNFINSAIPELQQYLEKRYGVQYEAYKKAVPYKLVPYVY